MFFDDEKPTETQTSMLETGSGILGMIPGVSTVMNLGNMAYHGGSAVYDGLHGDRDGAIAHGTQAAMSALGAMPGVGDAMEGADAVALAAGGAARENAANLGLDPSQIPAGLGDLAANAAVFGTNAIFGADDSNWIDQPGGSQKPTGNRAGEIQAGADMLGYLAGGPIFGEEVGGFLKPLVTGAGEYFGSDLAGPTSGVPDAKGGSYAQRAGAWVHDGGLMDTAPQVPPSLRLPGEDAPDTSPIEVPVTGPTLPVPPDDLLY